MKKIILSSIFISAFILLGSVYQASALSFTPGSIELGTKNCLTDGGKTSTRKEGVWDYPVCLFTDGSTCNLPNYELGSCGIKKYSSLDQLPSSCTSAQGNKCGGPKCTKDSDGQWNCKTTLLACPDMKPVEQELWTCKKFDTSSPVMYSSLDQLPSSCTSAYDGCNNCSRSAGGQWACTMMACLDVKQPAVTCTGYKKVDDKPAICTKEYAPVCGQPPYTCKGTCVTVMPQQKTYSNTCMMKADGATLVSEGVCGDQGQKICTMEYAPVCGKKTVVNDCKSTATTSCITIASWEKSKTYSNTCMMKADGATFVRSGECNADNDVWVEPPVFCSDNGFKKLNRGTRGEHVRALQQYLSDNGYNPGSIDGVFGRRVVEAVRAFQRDRGLKQDGVFGNGSRAKICNS